MKQRSRPRVLGRTRHGVAVGVLLALTVGAAPAHAQSGVADILRRGRDNGGARPGPGFFDMVTRDPRAFAFRHGWLEQAQRVRDRRQALRSRRAWNLLNASPAPSRAPGPSAARTVLAPGATAVTGTLKMPTFIVWYANTIDTTSFDSATAQNRLWGTAPAPPYSVTTYYQEVSRNRMTVTGTVVNRGIRLAANDTVYSGPGSCQGLCFGGSKVSQLIAEAVAAVDAQVNFAQYDLNGDGYVDATAFLHPIVGGECYLRTSLAARSIWSHRFSYSGWTGAPLQTNDPDPQRQGQFIKIDDYIIQSYEGGSAGCTPGAPIAIGTITHETGHLFGLPDLYDTNPNDANEGDGHWDLMASGNQQLWDRPAHMSAWTRADLGWITEVPLTSPGTTQASPIETNDTAFIVPIPASNEYFLLENRQRLGSDTNLAGPGLLIWHVDSLLMRQRLGSNTVNAVQPNALRLMQADGFDHLGLGANRGDAGDPFPGSSGNTVFDATTNPAAKLNSGLPTSIQIDSIRQVTPFGAMAFRLVLGSRIRASDPSAMVKVNGVAYSDYQSPLFATETLTVSIDSVQSIAAGATRFEYRSWSNAGTRTQTVIVTPSAPVTLIAQLATFNRVAVTRVGNGTVTGSPAALAADTAMVLSTATITLTAHPSPQNMFVEWDGDAAGFDPSLVLSASRPYAVTVTFAPLLLDSAVAQLLQGTGLTDIQRQLLDSQGNANGTFDLGDFVAWLDRSGTTVNAAVMARVLGRVRR